MNAGAAILRAATLLRHLFPMTELMRILHDDLAASPTGRLTFAQVMAHALYHRQYGYYGPGPRRIGRGGDFYTAVSVGPLYGRLLAEWALEVWKEQGSPVEFAVIEQAAHDGQLAEDICQQLLTEKGAAGLRYLIVEPNPRYEVVQRQRLERFGEQVQWMSSLAELPAIPALFICNELPDAMPVHLVRWNGQIWQELYVEASNGELILTPAAPSSPELEQELSRLPTDLSEDYTTEVNLAALAWMRELIESPFHGLIYIADYGLDDFELYSPTRSTGTLRRYTQHQTDDRVLENLGACDLTTHINFTRLIETAEAGGMKTRHYELQGRFLGKLALPVLATLEGRMDGSTQAVLRQYQSLTHPAFMGRSFRILTLDKPNELA